MPRPKGSRHQYHENRGWLVASSQQLFSDQCIAQGRGWRLGKLLTPVQRTQFTHQELGCNILAGGDRHDERTIGQCGALWCYNNRPETELHLATCPRFLCFG